MFHQPITSAVRKALSSFLTYPAFSSRAAARCSQTSRSISAFYPCHRNPITSKASFTFFKQQLAPFRSRQFTSSARSHYGFGNQPYRRFNNPRGQPFIWRLLGNAKPHHFVIIGLGISGLYIYNTETVEVRLDNTRPGCCSGFSGKSPCQSWAYILLT